jgi:hypothetical protein
LLNHPILYPSTLLYVFMVVKLYENGSLGIAVVDRDLTTENPKDP